MMKASPTEIVAKVMASLDKVEKELSPTSSQVGDNEEWEVHKRKKRGKKTRCRSMWDS